MSDKAMTTNQTIDGVPRDYLLRLTPEAHATMLGMVEHCLNVRACMGMDEGFKDFDTEEEHDFVQELRALLNVERCTSCDDSGDLIDLTGEWRGYCVCPAGVALKNKSAAQPQGEPVAYVDYRASGGVRWRPWEHGHLADGAPLFSGPAEQPAPVAVVDALSTGFYTTESGGGKYAINIGFRSMADMQAADAQLRELLKSR